MNGCRIEFEPCLILPSCFHDNNGKDSKQLEKLSQQFYQEMQKRVAEMEEEAKMR